MVTGLVAMLAMHGCSREPPPESSLETTVPAPVPDESVQDSEDTAEDPTTRSFVESDRAVVLVSLDGFRWDYLDRVDTPNLDRLIADGIRSEGLIPVFPSKTFPNHFTQVTGLYPHEHGIVGNSFYDEDLGRSFDFDQIGSEWWLGEPIWVTASKQGLRTTTMFWPGSETDYDGWRADEWLPYDGSMRNEDRVDTVLGWFDEEQPPHFSTLYFSDTDGAGHYYGPDSPQVDSAVAVVDTQLGRLLDGLEERDIFDTTDVIVVSDHGMTQLSRDRAIFLDDYVDPDRFWIAAWGPYVTLDPKNGDATGVLEELEGLPHASCSDDETRPAELHAPSGPRIPAILCVAELGWGITSREWFEEHPDDLTGATHGYLSSDRDMHGLFVARGPHFRSAESHPAFSSVHLYELLSELLQIEPAPNSGSAAETAGMLR